MPTTVHSEYEEYFDHLCTVSIIPAHFYAENTHRWSHEWDLEQITFGGGQLEYLEYWQYFGSIYCEYSQCSGVLYCGYCLYILQVFRGSILRILPVLAVLTAHTPSTRSILAFSAHTPSIRSISDASTVILLVLAVRNVLDTPSILGV